MNRIAAPAAGKIELRELVARAFYSDQFRLRSFDTAKPWQKQMSYKRADEALRRAGVDNVCVKTRIMLTENHRRAN